MTTIRELLGDRFSFRNGRGLVVFTTEGGIRIPEPLAGLVEQSLGRKEDL